MSDSPGVPNGHHRGAAGAAGAATFVGSGGGGRGQPGSPEGGTRSKSISPGGGLQGIWAPQADDDEAAWRAQAAPRRASIPSLAPDAAAPDAAHGLSRARATSVPAPYADMDGDAEPQWARAVGPAWRGGMWDKARGAPQQQQPDEAAPGRQQRSLSFSLGTFRPEEDPLPASSRTASELMLGSPDARLRAADAAYPYGQRNRSRSQSSSAIFGIDEGYDASEETTVPLRRGDESPGWADERRPPTSPASAPQHRRSLSVTQQDSWEKDYPPTTMPLASGDDEGTPNRRMQRRFSHSPQLYFDHAAMPNRPGGDDEELPHYDANRRRHSVGAPMLYGNLDAPQDLSDSFAGLRVDDAPPVRPSVVMGTYYEQGPQYAGQQQPLYPEDINDYFENQEHRARAWVEGTRNLQMQQYSQRWPLYVVEFKAGRKDFFFVPEGGGVSPKKGDFVVVEADRGKDLGKVVHDSIRSQAELQAYQQLHHANFLDNHAGKEVHAKKIYRLAQPTELSMLGSKMADEEKAMAICQGKVRSKRLPMEVVDAEYQWDRRKLTFYFVADRRIDFRELVRDLFKIYKTRIWLCACGGQVSRDGGSGDDGGGSPQRPQRDFAPRDFAPREYAAPPPDFPPMVPVVVPPYVVGPHFRPMTLAPAPMGYVAPMPAVPYPRDVRGVDGRR